ncbi:MAG: hypothetical protein Q9201_001803 [Fulgogasparrea decipioides]
MSKADRSREDVTELDRLDEHKGYVVDTKHIAGDTEAQEEIEAANLKTTSDGHTILVPQPTNEPNDPLNRSPLLLPAPSLRFRDLSNGIWPQTRSCTMSQGGELMFIKNVLFYPEYAREFNVWSCAIILSPLSRPCRAAFMLTTQKVGVPFWVDTPETGLSVVLNIIFMDETGYNHQIPIKQ